MAYLLDILWPWLLAALLLGMVIGWVTCSRDRGNWFTGWVPWALAGFALLLVMAAVQLLPGRAGLWLETGLLLFTAYIVGCCLGCWVKQMSAGEPAVVAAGGAAAGAASLARSATTAPAARQAATPVAAAAPTAPSARAAVSAAGGVPTPLPEPVFSALRAGNPASGLAAASVAGAAGANPATTDAASAARPAIASPASAAAPSAANAPAPASIGGAPTLLPEPVYSLLRGIAATASASPVAAVPIVAASTPAAAGGRSSAAPAPAVSATARAAETATPAIAPARADVAVATAAVASATDPSGVAFGHLPEPVASALAQRLPLTTVAIMPHPMSGLPRPGTINPGAAVPQASPQLAASTVARPGAPPLAAPAAPSPTNPPPASAGPAGTAAPAANASARVSSAASGGFPEPIATALRGASATGAASVAQGMPPASGPHAPSLHGHPGQRPAGLPSARGGAADDLILVKGVGPNNAAILNGLGIWHFDQIAQWTPGETQWVGSYMSFPGRIEREHWIAQCRLLAAGGETEHSRAVKSGALHRSQVSDSAIGEADSAALKAGLEDIAPPLPDEEKHEGKRPFGLAKPRGAKADDLKRVRGIGPQNEGRLHALGIWHFDQIARWSRENVAWVGSYLAFPGRIDREEWISQAKVLGAGAETEFSKRAAAGLVPTSKDDGSKGQSNLGSIQTGGGHKG